MRPPFKLLNLCPESTVYMYIGNLTTTIFSFPQRAYQKELNNNVEAIESLRYSEAERRSGCSSTCVPAGYSVKHVNTTDHIYSL